MKYAAVGSDLMLDLGPNALFAILRSLEGLRQGGAESSLQTQHTTKYAAVLLSY